MASSGPTIREIPDGEDIDSALEIKKIEPAEDDLDEELDETLVERLVGLTEMFPDPVRSFTCNLVGFTYSGTKSLYSICRAGLWVAASSACILALPVMFESERAAMEEQQLQQQRQILLGPNAAVSGGAGGPGMMPGIAPQPASR